MVQWIHQIIGELCPHLEDQVLFICHSDIYTEAKEFGDGIKRSSVFRTFMILISVPPSVPTSVRD